MSHSHESTQSFRPTAREFGWLALFIAVSCWLLWCAFVFAMRHLDGDAGFSYPTQSMLLYLSLFFGAGAAIGIGFGLHSLRGGGRSLGWTASLANLAFLMLVAAQLLWPD